VSPALPSLSGSEVIDALRRAGFESVRTKGSHHKLRSADGRGVIVPLHRELARGTLRSICDRRT
jgi:predicted RNA binding protein YcfA (HicA-like mRNA interferase family)